MTFDQKWGTKILIATVLFVSLYFTSNLVPPQSQAVNLWGADDFWWNYYEGIAGEQFEDAGFGDHAPAWDDIFGNTNKDNGKNLYLLIYQELKSGPADAALESTAAYFGFTRDIAMDIMDGNIHEVVKYDASIAEYDASVHDLKTLQGAMDMYYDVYEYYDQQLAIETMSSELSTKVKIQGMFTNGDTSDSGFDLIVDLQTIEYILFGEVNQDGYGTSDGGLDLGGSSDDGGSLDTNSDGSETGDGDSEGDDGSSDEEAASGGEDSEGAGDPISDRNECFEDSELSQAFAGLLGSGNLDGDSDDGKVKVSGNDDDGDGTGDSDDDGDSDDESGDDGDSLEALPAGDWGRDLPCDDFICLEINFISGEDEEEVQYEETTNCIDCHFTYISETLKEVTSHSLTPGKAPGNMLEDATCKGASTGKIPSINVFAISSPILTPANDDIIVDVSGKWENFMDALQPNRHEEEDEYDPEDTTNYLSTGDERLMWATSVKGDSLTSVELSDEVIEQAFEEFNARIEMAEELSMSSQMTDMTTMFQSLQYEMDAMNSIFSAILMSLSTDLEYLSQIRDKPYQQ